MAIIINASTSTGLVQSADTSGILEFQSNGTTKATLNSSGLAISQYNPSISLVTSGTALATTSNTSIDFTSIPSWVKRITVMFRGVSQNTSTTLILQIGSGGVTTSGYASTSSFIAPSTHILNVTTGFPINNSSGGGEAFSGLATICLLGSNTYCFSAVVADTANAQNHFGAGSVVIGGALDTVRLTTISGTATLDAGSFNILYE